MDFYAVLEQVLALPRQRGRVSYRALKRQFDLDEAYLDDLKVEIIEVHQCAVDQEGLMLVWTGAIGATPLPTPTLPVPVHLAPTQADDASRDAVTPPTAVRSTDAERRQLTVMFCDLVDSTRLSSQLDPEEYWDVVRAYQSMCTDVIQHYDGHIAQLLGDGLLIYFGYPQAHADDAQRAVRTGLGILAAMGDLNQDLQQEKGIQLALRMGIHTGLVVVGQMGGAGRQEHLALGEVPNVASRIQGLAEPNTIMISTDTYRLIQGYFDCQALGAQALRGMAEPLHVYRVLQDSGARGHLDVAATRGLTPLVGREQDVGLLVERWEQVKAGHGQVVLLSGEGGMGKSRLVQVLTDHIANEPHVRWECRSVPYYQNTALYPLTDLFQRLLQWQPDETSDTKLGKLEQALSQYRLPLEETVPLFAPLLALPVPENRYPLLNLSPQRQRQKTLETLVAMLLELAEHQPALFIVEDLHWTDPTTLELLNLVLDQTPTASLLVLLTCRPSFHPTWPQRSSLTEITVNRLSHAQVAQMVAGITEGKIFPTEMLQQIMEKTDGVPLFIEEVTKMILASGLLQAHAAPHARTDPLPALAIPATLHDALMARLDQCGSSKAVAQLGATLGRTFAYDLLHAVSPWDETPLQHGLRQLVEAELVAQRGVPPQATYQFKHALIQETAYQSLLTSTRQQYHQHIAQVLERQFPEVAETQPELLAHHSTEAGRAEQAVVYWQRAGQQALQRSANPEAVRHLNAALALLATLSETPARAQQELDVQLALGPALIALKGATAPEVEQTYARAHALCRQVSETPQRFPTLWGLWRFYLNLGVLPTARELGEQLSWLAQRATVPTHRITAHAALGTTLFLLGDYVSARTPLEQGSTLTDLGAQRSAALSHSVAPGIVCLAYAALTLWCLGSPTQAVQRSQEALALAQDLSHPLSLVFAQFFAAMLHHHRREAPAVQTQAEALLTLATAQGFPFYVGCGMGLRGWALAVQGQGETSLAQTHQGMTAILATGNIISQPLCRVMCAEAAGHVGQVKDGLRLLAAARTGLEANGQGDLLAEVYRLQGEFLLRQATSDAAQAEACFQQALAVARRQQAKSWELRAAMSLSRLWQQQSKRTEAYDLLAPVYDWFTEGFDTADLQDAQVLLEELGR